MQAFESLRRSRGSLCFVPLVVVLVMGVRPFPLPVNRVKHVLHTPHTTKTEQRKQESSIKKKRDEIANNSSTSSSLKENKRLVPFLYTPRRKSTQSIDMHAHTRVQAPTHRQLHPGVHVRRKGREKKERSVSDTSHPSTCKQSLLRGSACSIDTGIETHTLSFHRGLAY